MKVPIYYSELFNELYTLIKHKDLGYPVWITDSGARFIGEFPKKVAHIKFIGYL